MYAITIRFDNQARRKIFYSESSTSDEDWIKARRSIDTLAETDINTDEFWGKVKDIFEINQFIEVRE